MIVLRYLGYVIACQFFCLRLAFYYIHSFFVFLAKPGARLVLPLIVIGIVFLVRIPIRKRYGETIDVFWNGTMRAILGPNITDTLQTIAPEVTIVGGIVIFAILFFILSSILAPIVGTFSAPSQPLPPLPPLIIPDTQVKTVRASVAVAARGRSAHKGDLGSLIERVPENVRRIVTDAERNQETPPLREQMRETVTQEQAGRGERFKRIPTTQQRPQQPRQQGPQPRQSIPPRRLGDPGDRQA